MNERRPRRFQFTTRHLLWLTVLVALSVTALILIVESVGYSQTDVEIIKIHDTGTVEFRVTLPNGFSQSGVSIPPHASPRHYEKLVGTQLVVRYRDRQVLWKPPEDPTMVAIQRVQLLVDGIAEGSRDAPPSQSARFSDEY